MSRQRLLAAGVMAAGLAIFGVVLQAIALEKASALVASEELLPEELLPETPIQRPYAPLRPYTACPTDIETLMALLIRDIPSYTNRVLQRSVAVLPRDQSAARRVESGSMREPYRPSSVLIAGRLELEPLDLNDYVLTTSPTSGGQITQAFFTTLSRQYSGQYSSQPLGLNRLSIQEVQEYHWLLLTPASDGWRLVLMFSAIDNLKSPRPLLPPRENSQGSVGQAIQIWLRDCRAGAIYPLDSSPLENLPENLPESPLESLPSNSSEIGPEGEADGPPENLPIPPSTDPSTELPRIE